MNNRIVLAIGFVATTLLSGCVSPETYARKVGPVVTNASLDGNGNLVVEKNTIVFNTLNGTFSFEGNPTTQTFQAPRK